MGGYAVQPFPAPCSTKVDKSNRAKAGGFNQELEMRGMCMCGGTGHRCGACVCAGARDTDAGHVYVRGHGTQMRGMCRSLIVKAVLWSCVCVVYVTCGRFCVAHECGPCVGHICLCMCVHVCTCVRMYALWRTFPRLEALVCACLCLGALVCARVHLSALGCT
jgi:hypothetical protein